MTSIKACPTSHAKARILVMKDSSGSTRPSFAGRVCEVICYILPGIVLVRHPSKWDAASYRLSDVLFTS